MCFPALWRVLVAWKHSSAGLVLPAPCETKFCASVMNWFLRLMSVCCWQRALLRVPEEARFPVLVSPLNIFTLLRPMPAEMKALPSSFSSSRDWLKDIHTLHTFLTYRLTFMPQHALLDFLGQDQVARLRSGPSQDYNSPCVLRWAWRGEQHKCALFYHRVNKIELNWALCFWKMPRVNTCAAPVVWRFETHAEHPNHFKT